MKTKKGNAYLLIVSCFITIFFISCSKQENEKAKINKVEFTELLKETYLIEARLNDVRLRGENVEEKSDQYYQELFNKNRTTEEDFTKSLKFYLARTPVMIEILDSVKVKLEAMKLENNHR